MEEHVLHPLLWGVTSNLSKCWRIFFLEASRGSMWLPTSQVGIQTRSLTTLANFIRNVVTEQLMCLKQKSRWGLGRMPHRPCHPFHGQGMENAWLTPSRPAKHLQLCDVWADLAREVKAAA